MANATLNKVQKAAVESFGKPILIFAGAGSGKTRVLTHKIAHLIKEDLVKPDRVFKSYQEMIDYFFISRVWDNKYS